MPFPHMPSRYLVTFSWDSFLNKPDLRLKAHWPQRPRDSSKPTPMQHLEFMPKDNLKALPAGNLMILANPELPPLANRRTRARPKPPPKASPMTGQDALSRKGYSHINHSDQRLYF